MPRNAGTYNIKIRLDETINYLVSEKVIENITISKKDLTVTPKSAEMNCLTPYISNSDVSMVEFSGFVNNETYKSTDGGITINVKEEYAGEFLDAGKYDLLVSGTYNPSNYNVIFKTNENGLTVNKIDNTELSFTANSQIKYGESLVSKLDIVNPAESEGSEITYSYKPQDGSWVNDALPRDVGIYTIKITSSQTKNYNQTDFTRSIYIDKADLTITAKDVTIKYDGTLGELEAIYVGFAYGEDESVLTGTMTLTTEYSAGSQSGEYGIKFGTKYDEVQANYNVKYVEGLLTVEVTNNDLVITLPKTVILYGDELTPTVTSNPSGEILYYTYKNLETQEEGTGLPKNVGTYEIKVKSYGNANYQEASLDLGSLKINPKELTITAKDKTITYREGYTFNGVDDVVFDGFVNNETYSVLGIGSDFEIKNTATYTTNEEGYLDAGTYSIKISESTKTATNYTIIYVDGNLIVERATAQLIVNMSTGGVYGTKLDIVTQCLSDGDLTFMYAKEITTDVYGEWNTTTKDNLPTNVGKYKVKVTCEQTKNYNYVESEEKFAEITKKELVVAPYVIGMELRYGEELKQCQVYGDGFITGEDMSVINQENIEYITNYTVGANAGTYNLTISGLSSENYEIKYETKEFEVLKALNTLNPIVSGVVYGNTIAVELNGINSNENVVVEYANVSNLSAGSELEYTTIVPTNAGVYNVRISQAENTNFKDYINIFTNIAIEQKEVTIVWSDVLEFTYNGTRQLPTATIEGLVYGDECNATIDVLSGDAVTAGNYNATVVEISNKNYALPANKSVSYVIYKIVVADPQAPASKQYTGEKLYADIEAVQEDLYTVTNNGGIEAGQYIVEYNLIDPTNYKWQSVEDAWFTMLFEITKATDNSIITAVIGSYDYDPISVTTSIDAEAKYGNVLIEYKAVGADDSEFTPTLPQTAGNYVARFRVIETTSYNGCEKFVEFTVNKINPTYTEVTNLVS
ncbi:MAG: hypothetical protein IJW82_05145, partial [Clostridia bacterium]|nr:hypothetical protein [Clostridia bacterium]